MEQVKITRKVVKSPATETQSEPSKKTQRTVSKKITKKTEEVQEETPVEIPVETPVESTVETSDESSTETVEEQLTIEQRLKGIRDQVAEEIKNVTRSLHKMKLYDQTLKQAIVEYRKEQKLSSKAYRRKLRKERMSSNGETTNVKRNHGFLKEQLMSPELASVLGLEKTTTVSYPMFSKIFFKYIKENKLSDPKDGKLFTLNSDLLPLLGKPRFPINKKSDELGYSIYNIKAYMKGHFPYAQETQV